MNTDRNITFDIAKGIAIILIVLGHIRNGVTDTPLDSVISFINYFHVAVFFVISGYFVSPLRGWKDYLVKKAKRLALPYLAVNALLMLLDILVCSIVSHSFQLPSVKDIVRAFAGIDPFRLAIPTWFLMTLFYVSVIYKLIYNVCRNNVRIAFLASVLISIICFIVQNHSSISGVVFATRVTVSLGFFSIGHLLHERIGYMIDKISTKTSVLSFMVSFAFLLVLYFVIEYRVSFYWLKGYNIFLTYLSGISGTIMIISISALIGAFVKKMNGSLIFIGRNSMPILLWHYVVFAALSALLFGGNLLSVMDSVCIDPGHGRWILYLVFGVAVPILPAILQHNMRRIV